jgi:hypothetical protein
VIALICTGTGCRFRRPVQHLLQIPEKVPGRIPLDSVAVPDSDRYGVGMEIDNDSDGD